jgi:hypothetical protein
MKKFLKNDIAKTITLFTKRREEKKLKQKQNAQKTIDILSLPMYRIQ